MHQIVDESAGYTCTSQPRTKEIDVNTVLLEIYCKVIGRAPSIPSKIVCQCSPKFLFYQARGPPVQLLVRRQCAHTLLWSGLTWTTVLLFGRPTLRRTNISLKEYRNEPFTGSAPSGIQQRSRGVIPMRVNSLNSTGYQSPNDTKLCPCVKHTRL